MKNLIHKAIIFATQKHGNDKRKGTDIPYITHPMEVMQILSENGYSEKVIIAGILHDTLEDTNTGREEILNNFGNDILFIINAESEDKSKTWHERKQATIDHLQNASIEIKAVCLADKLSNLRSMCADQEIVGENLWNRFNASKDDIEWYYRGVFNILSKLNKKMCSEYKELLDKIFFKPIIKPITIQNNDQNKEPIINQVENIIDSKKPLNVVQAAEFLNIKPQSLYNLVHNRKITTYKPGGGRLYFKLQDLEKYAYSNKISSSSDLSELADLILLNSQSRRRNRKNKGKKE